jgi:hypothetical protein
MMQSFVVVMLASSSSSPRDPPDDHLVQRRLWHWWRQLQGQQQQHQHAATAAVSLSGMPVSCPALTGGNVGGHDTPPFLRAFSARGTHDHSDLAVRLRATGKFKYCISGGARVPPTLL